MKGRSLSFSSLVIEDSLRSIGRSLSEPGVRAASGGRTQAGKARGLRCRRPHGSGGGEGWWGPWAFFWAKTALELNVGLPRPPKAPLERAAKEAELVGRPKGSMWVLGLRKGPWAPGAAVKGLAAAWTAPVAVKREAGWESSCPGGRAP